MCNSVEGCVSIGYTKLWFDGALGVPAEPQLSDALFSLSLSPNYCARPRFIRTRSSQLCSALLLLDPFVLLAPQLPRVPWEML